jgi:hypothetical protein
MKKRGNCRKQFKLLLEGMRIFKVLEFTLV